MIFELPRDDGRYTKCHLTQGGDCSAAHSSGAIDSPVNRTGVSATAAALERATGLIWEYSRRREGGILHINAPPIISIPGSCCPVMKIDHQRHVRTVIFCLRTLSWPRRRQNGAARASSKGRISHGSIQIPTLVVCGAVDPCARWTIDVGQGAACTGG